MATKRISRQEVTAPGAESSYERTVNFLQEHWKSILIGLLILLTAVVVVMIVMRSRAEAEERAHGIWLIAQQDVAARAYASALEHANRLLAEHGGTTSGDRGTLIKADALAGLGRHQEALAAYRTARERLTDDPLLVTAAIRGEATMLEDLGQHGEAAATWASLAETTTIDATRIFDFKNAARNYAMAGDTAAAMATYERLVETFEDSTDRVHVQEVHLAKVAIAELRHAKGAGETTAPAAS